MTDQVPIGGLQPPKKKVYESDVVICIDGTGSMSPCIEAVKSNIEEVLTGVLQEQATANNAEFSVRLRLIVFRDVLVDGDRAIEAYEFDQDVSSFVDKLRNVEAMGGGDEAESALDALAYGLTSDWTDPSRVRAALVLLTDAPTHPRVEASTLEAIGHQDNDAAGDVHWLIGLISTLKAKVFIVGPEDPVYSELGKDGIATYKRTNRDGLGDMDIGQFLSVMFKTVTQSSVTLKMTESN